MIYKLYKPLRNYLRQFWIGNAFYVIWAYINYFQFSKSFPKDIEINIEALNRQRRSVYEWELSLLAREVIVNSSIDSKMVKKSFNKWSCFAGSINKIKEFENNIWPLIGGVSVLRNEFRRISHRQFPWQQHVTSADFVRYYKIYNSPRIENIIKRMLDIDIREWYTIGLSIFGAFLTCPKMKIDLNIEISPITKKEFDIFLNFVSADLDQIKETIKRDVKYNDEYVYSFNPLEYYPIVRVDEYYYCPVVNFLLWRITSGLFFDLVKDSDFGAHFGLAFQDYLLEISNKVLNSNTMVIPEAKYKIGKKQKDAVDIILNQDNCMFFVEAKAKRMQVKAKTKLCSKSEINKDLDILAEDIVQVYQTLNDYKNGHYENIKHDECKKIYPLIVTLEDWFLIGEDLLYLYNRVLVKLGKKGLPIEILKESPYVLCSVRIYEILIQVLNKHSIENILLDWFKPEKKGHDFGNFLLTNYGEGCEQIDHFFPEDFDEIYIKKN